MQFNMSTNIFSIFIILITHICCYTIKADIPDHWIDPHDMSPSKDYLKYNEGPLQMHYYEKQDDSCDCDYGKINKVTKAYFKRTINMLLNSVHEDNFMENKFSGHLLFEINSESYKFLKHFAENMDESEDLAKVDSILQEIFNKPTHQHLQEYLESWFHKCLNVILSREGIIAITILTYMFVVYKMFHAKFYSMYVLKFLLINFFIFDFIFTWIQLYQKEQSEMLVARAKLNNMPIECNPENMDSWQFLWSLFSKEDACEKYYKLEYQDIFWKVSPGTVLTEMFARTIQYPAKYIGAAFGDLCNGMYNAFPWPLNIIIFPITLIAFCIMTCILMSFIFSVNIKFNFFHLISFSFGDKSHLVQNKDMISGANVEKLLRIAQKDENRQFIEEISDIKKTLTETIQRQNSIHSNSKQILSIDNKNQNDIQKKDDNVNQDEICEQKSCFDEDTANLLLQNEKDMNFGGGDH